MAHHVFVGGREEPRIEFDTDDETDTRHHLTESLSVGAGIEIESTVESNLDLDRDVDEDESGIEPSLEAAVTWEPTRDLRFYGELEVSREFFFETENGNEAELELEIEEAYVAYRGLEPGPVIIAGRQDVEDERKWVVDRSLDGVRLIQRFGDVAIEGLVARQELLRDDLLGEFRDDRANNFYLRGHWGFTEDSQASAYALYRHGRNDDAERLLWLGAQSLGELADDLEYWLDAAVVLGEDETNDIKGFGIDVGGTYEFDDLPLRPTATLGFAYGSGDDKMGADAGFRQTSMQDNKDRFGGVTSFKYYGEALNPELSNLVILTAGLGVRPSRRSSVDLVYHRYFQAEAFDDLRDTELETDPTGRSTDIGHGVDLVVGIRELDDVAIEATVGLFIPGDAFVEDDLAMRAGLEIKIDF